MVKRACAAHIGQFAAQLEKEHLIGELLPVFKQLVGDELDTIRVLCIESLIPLASVLSKQENCTYTLGTVLMAGEDKSWKVRLSFAKNFAKISQAFGREITDGNFI